MNKITSLHIENFTVFKKNTIEFSPGLNVLIGKNGTGKTHLLKVLYSFLRSSEDIIDKDKDFVQQVNSSIPANLLQYFRGESLTYLHRYKKGNDWLSIDLRFFDDDFINYQTAILSDLPNHGVKEKRSSFPESLYIPPQEMLSIFDGFIASWEKRENGFDQTYYDLAKALSLSPLKDTKLLEDLVAPIEKILDAKVLKEGGRFFLEYKWGKIEAHLVAEGLRKLSQIIYLIGNGSINENTILLWDEPEVHFNPSLIEAIMVLLKGLVGKGLQIFITTHDYLLSQRLSLISEYEDSQFPVKFFCLENDGDNGIKIEEGSTLAEIDSNPILDEFAEYYDFERAAFHKVKK
jgi:predicted ATPase